MKPTYTSESLPLAVDFLPPDRLPLPGQIGFAIAPGRQDEDSKAIWQRDLQADLTRLKDHYRVDRLVCLLGADERAGLGIATLLDDATALGIATENLPIVDDELPTSLEAFTALVDRIVAATAAGETVVVHCRGGGGRTGTVVAACLVKLGYSAEDAIAAVQQARSGALGVAAQRDFIHRFAAQD
ncbi:dual specificity protein phosphatase family protein [Nodosilinea sp. PGN35]|uniref:phosphatase domain-containing protein n=1 Tax=Nodosilinea sp. PGN35 TaxID=3020489 RepID=UPI0023B2A13B|nr:dual specificity protein phosphatase family protein [Nodosilinea sp. TSF1-S3]MDF0365145.1 dual specificity protein phosphatase family protein [Nodosilinea sp. TSF1-S3]